jgi:hypothetical protein
MKIITSASGKNMLKEKRNFMRKIHRKVPHYRKSAEIVELAEAFEDCTLPPEKLTHEVYLTIIFWHLFFNSPAEAELLIRNSLRRYCFEHNIASTDESVYHEATMLFWIEKIRFYLERFGEKLSFLELANGVMRNFKDPNLSFGSYSREHLFSPRPEFQRK